MRILHFSDLHIGVESYGRLDPQTGLSSRIADFLHTYDEVLNCAIQENVDLVLFCGDAYKNRDPSQTHQRAFAQGIAQLSKSGIPVFLVVGNHDLPATRARATALDIFSILKTPGVTIGDRVQTYTIDTPSGPIQIVALPWIRRSEFIAHSMALRDDHNSSHHGSIEDVNRYIEERLSQFVYQAASNIDPSIPAILAGHCTLSGATASSEQTMMLGRDHVLLRSSIALPNFDYVALGHIHRAQVLNDNPPIVYSGSLQRIDFGEENHTKGFYLIELDPTKRRGERLLSYTFREVNARHFLTIPVVIPEDCSDPTQLVLEAIPKYEIEGSVVRLAVTVPRSLERMLNEERIREALSEAFFVAPMERQILGERRTRWQGETLEATSPLETLRLYLDTRHNIDDAAKTILINHAQELLEDEQV